MIRPMCLAFILAYATSSIIIVGCSKREPRRKTNNADQSTHQGDTDQTETSGGSGSVRTLAFSDIEQGDSTTEVNGYRQFEIFDRTLKLWEEESTESAVNMFLRIDWEDPQIFSGNSILNLTEKEFITLSESERSRIKVESQRFLKRIGDLVKHIREVGRKFIAAKEFDKTERHLNAVLQCGKVLSETDTLVVIRLYGTSIQRLAFEELILLHGETGDQAKLKAAQERLSEVKRSRSTILGR